MQKHTSGNSASSKNNKSKNGIDCELPKINKSFFQELSEPMSLKFHWLTIDKDYSPISNHQIEQEYNLLRKQLISLNELAVKNIEKLNLNRSYIKRKIPGQLQKAVEVSERQIQNNNSIIVRLRYEHQQLKKRVSFLEETNKDQLSSIIQQTKQKINGLRIKNRQLQKKSKDIGNNIQNFDDFFNEIKQLQIQKDLAERKKQKLQDKTKEVESNLQKIITNLQMIDGGAQQATKFIEQQLQQQKVGEAGKQIHFIFKKKMNQIQILSKNKQSLNNIKQQRYHQALKQLQTLNRNIQELSKNIHLSQQKDIANKKQKKQLQLKLEELKNMRKSQLVESPFYTQIVEFQDKTNDLSKKETIIARVNKIKYNKIQQKSSLMKVHNNTTSEKMREHDKSKIAQTIKESKTLVLRSNIQSSKNKAKYTKTQSIDEQKQQKSDVNRYNNTLFNKRVIVDKKSIEIKRQSQNRDNYKQLSNNKPKFNTVQITNKPQVVKRNLNKKNNSKLLIDRAQIKVEKQNKPHGQIMKQSKIIQEIEKYDEQNSNSLVVNGNKSKIHEQIQSSNLSQISNFNSKQNNKRQEQQMQERLKREDRIKISKKDQDEEVEVQVQVEKEQQQQQNDADLQQFKKSINSSRQNFNLDKQQINIALGEIQDTIKRNEMQSKIRKYSPQKSIHQEQQSFS